MGGSWFQGNEIVNEILALDLPAAPGGLGVEP